MRQRDLLNIKTLRRVTLRPLRRCIRRGRTLFNVVDVYVGKSAGKGARTRGGHHRRRSRAPGYQRCRDEEHDVHYATTSLFARTATLSLRDEQGAAASW